MREVSERTFKAYVREAVKELNETELTATVKFYLDGVDIRLFRDGYNVGCVFIYTNGEIEAMDETTGTEIEINPLHDTMKDVFKAIPEAVNAHLDENGFMFEEQETTETTCTLVIGSSPVKELANVESITFTLLGTDAESPLTLVNVKNFRYATEEEVKTLEAKIDGSCIDKNHQYLTVEFTSGNEATFRRSSIKDIHYNTKATTEEKNAEEVKLSVVRIHLECSIKKWYENAKLDYGINGRFLECKAQGDNLFLFWEEEGKKYTAKIGYYKDYSPEQIFNIWMEDDGEEVTEEEIRQYIPQETDEPQPTPEDADREIDYSGYKPEQDYSEEDMKAGEEIANEIGIDLLEQQLKELEELEEESDRIDDAWDQDPMNAELEQQEIKAYEREWNKYMEASKTLAKLIDMDTKTARQMLQRGSKNRQKVWELLNRRQKNIKGMF